MVRRAGLGVQQHSDGWRAPLRLGLGTMQDPVRTSLAGANQDLKRLKVAKSQSVRTARALLSEMKQKNDATTATSTARRCVTQ